jgi:hypothetical protein
LVPETKSPAEAGLYSPFVRGHSRPEARMGAKFAQQTLGFTQANPGKRL